MTICPQCHAIGGRHKLDCSLRPGRQAVVPMTADEAMSQAIARTPSLVQLDASEADIIAAARVVADLPIPAIVLSSTEAMVERDHLIAAMEDLRDAIQRADGTGPWS